MTLTSYGPRALVSTGLSDTYCREEMHVCPRQEAGWGHCTHVKLHAMKALEQSFKKLV